MAKGVGGRQGRGRGRGEGGLVERGPGGTLPNLTPVCQFTPAAARRRRCHEPAVERKEPAAC